MNRLYIILSGVCIIFSLFCCKQKNELPVAIDTTYGACNMPFIRYDSGIAVQKGQARTEKAPDFDFHNTASEAHNQEYLILTGPDDYMDWKIKEKANGITIRFTLPDNEEGESVGQESSLDIFVNNKYAKTIRVTSRWAWQYFIMKYYAPVPYITDMPLMRFDETHFCLQTPLQPGDEIGIRKSTDDGLECGIDVIEIEEIYSPLSKPEKALSVKDFGAKGDGMQDDLPSFYACIDAATKEGKNIFIPENFSLTVK